LIVAALPEKNPPYRIATHWLSRLDPGYWVGVKPVMAARLIKMRSSLSHSRRSEKVGSSLPFGIEPGNVKSGLFGVNHMAGDEVDVARRHSR
jgi:hypothetical protein